VIYGYARVSTTDQDHASQVEHLTAAGALKVFSEKASGKDADRIQLKKAIAALDAGDVLMVTRIDRLARSTRDLLNIVHDVKQAGATFKSLAEPWADTSSELAEFMLTIIAAVAKLDRAIILERTAGGRARAKQRGRSLGRKPKLNPTQLIEVRAMQSNGRGMREIGEVLGHASTVSRALNTD
jgi:DNA invertase Pin-like site-specific DNA recombinase